MGSSSSSTRCSAKWKSGKQCSCCQSHYIVTKIRWISVPMPAEGLVKTGRLMAGIASLGITELAICKGHNYSHDVIELWMTCRKCRKIMRFTMEFSKSGKQATFGYYKLYKPGEGSVEKDIDNLTFLAARQIYNSTRGGKYDIGDNNCKHFAKRLYNQF